MKKSIHINCDLGEGQQNDALIMPYIQACNIACGGHAGNTQSMKATIDLAIQNNVTIGAHPSYEDKANFGRVNLSLSAQAIKALIESQINKLINIATSKAVKVTHVKPHGALYNQAIKDTMIAKSIAEAVKEIDNTLIVYAPFRSELARIAKALGLKVFYEAFLDRNYNQDLSLVSRKLEGATIQSPTAVTTHFKNIQKGYVKIQNGQTAIIKADTFCIHGDNPNVVNILKHLTNSVVTSN